MKFIISGKQLEVTEGLRDKVITKLGKLEKYFETETEVQVTLSVMKINQIVEVTIPFNGMVLRAEMSHEDLYTAIDRVVSILEKQLAKNKSKLVKKNHHESLKFLKPDNIDQYDEENDFKVVKSKKFAIKPMSIEEAILQMDLISHQFFMFLNCDTEKINVIYKRRDGNIGQIEPEM